MNSGPYSGLELSDLKQIMNSADPQGIRDTVTGFKSVSGSLDQVITTLQNSQQQLQASWQGSASDAASQTFGNVITQAQQTKSVSDAMVEHLPTLANQVEAAQQKVNAIQEPAKPSGFVDDVKSLFGDDSGYSAAKQAAASKAVGAINEADTQYTQSTSFMNSLTPDTEGGFTPTGAGSASGNGAFSLGGSNGAMSGYGGYGSGYDGGGADSYSGGGDDEEDGYRTGLNSPNGDGVYGGVPSKQPVTPVLGQGGGTSRLAGSPPGGGSTVIDPPIVTPIQPPTSGPWNSPLPLPIAPPITLGPAPVRGGGPVGRGGPSGPGGDDPLGDPPPGSRSGSLPPEGEELSTSGDDGILGSPNTTRLARNGFGSPDPEPGAPGEETLSSGPGGTQAGQPESTSMGGMGGGMRGGTGGGEGRGSRAGYLSEDEDYWTGGMPRSAGGDDGIFGGSPMSMTPAQQRNAGVRSAYSTEDAESWAGGRAGNPAAAAGTEAEGEGEGMPMMGMGKSGGSRENERRERPGYLRQESEYWQDQRAANPSVIDR